MTTHLANDYTNRIGPRITALARLVLLSALTCSAGTACGVGGPDAVPRRRDGGQFLDAGPPLDSLLGENVTAADAPPPISGGTLLVTHDDALAIVADPDRDRVVVFDLATESVLGEVALELHDEPGRLVEDAAGNLHVVLRRGGAVASLDPRTQTILARRPVCSVPRGIAYDASRDVIHVACASGELVTLPAAGGPATRTLALERDLRDVVVDGELLYVSRFRTADVLVVDAAGEIVERITLPSATDVRGMPTTPSVAWRMIRGVTGGVYVLHQRGRDAPIETSDPGGYGSSNACNDGDSIVHAAITPISRGAPPPTTGDLGCVVLGVDVAVSPTGADLAVAAAGNAPLERDAQLLRFAASSAIVDAFATRVVGSPLEAGTGRVVAVAYASTGTLVAQTREPAALALHVPGRAPRIVQLGGAARADTGHTVFHSTTAGGLACASCHPEGHEDGRVWFFRAAGPRRTQALGGGILGTEPFHWSGDMPSFDHLMSDVFASRMNGGNLSAPRVTALAHWIDEQPTLPLPPPADAAAVERGRVLFEDEIVGCATCHTGEHLTTNESVDVGTGGRFQVPSLHGVAWRAPYLHSGCAPTLRDRFVESCGGGEQHGRTAGLEAASIDDLVAYLESL